MNPQDLIVPALRGTLVPWPEDPVEHLEGAVLDAAADHGVTALLATAPAVDRWPDHVRTTLERAQRAEAATEIIRRQELIQLLAALREARVHALLTKGAGIAYTHYPRPWLRPRLDTDLLVAPSDRTRAGDVLQALGYRPQTHFAGELVTHQFQYERPNQYGVIDRVDLHWKLANPHLFADALPFDELARDAVPIAALDPNALGLSEAHAFVLACVHRVAHHDNSDRLIWLYDIHLLASAMDAESRDTVAALAGAKRLRSVCAGGLADARARFATSVPPGWVDRLQTTAAASEPTSRFLRSDMRKVDVLLSDLRALGWRRRLALIREHLFPPAAYIRKSYGVASPVLLPFTYVSRLLTGAGKWFRRQN